MFTKEFWLGDNGAAVRAVRTAAQTALAMITVATFSPFDLGQWRNVAIVSLTAAAISLLQSLDRREALLAPSPVEPPAELARSTPGVYITETAAPAAFVDTTPAYGCGDSIR